MQMMTEAVENKVKRNMANCQTMVSGDLIDDTEIKTGCSTIEMVEYICYHGSFFVKQQQLRQRLSNKD